MTFYETPCGNLGSCGGVKWFCWEATFWWHWSGVFFWENWQTDHQGKGW